MKRKRDMKYDLMNENVKEGKQALKALQKLMDDSKIKLSDDTTIKGPAIVTHLDSPALEINPKPVNPSEEMDLNDGFFVEKRKKRMFAILISYSGKGYHGLQM